MLKVGQVKEIYEMQGEGRSIRGIADDLGVARNTVRRYLKSPEAMRPLRGALELACSTAAVALGDVGGESVPVAGQCRGPPALVPPGSERAGHGPHDAGD